MSEKLTYLLSIVLVLGLVGLTNADPVTQDPGPDGIVCIEAEDFDEKTQCIPCV